jgi:integrase
MENVDRLTMFLAFSTVAFYGGREMQRKPKKTWEPTRLQNLVRHKSGRYYVRAFAGRKEIWRSLKTKQFSVAQAKLATFMREHRAAQENTAAVASGDMAFGDALAIHQRRIAANVTAKRIKPSTEHYWEQIYAALLKSWPGLASRDVRKITRSNCEAWSESFSRNASPTRFNNTLVALRHVFAVAIEAAAIYADPSAKIRRMRVRAKTLTLPTVAQFQQLLEEIRSAGAWCSKDCSDFVEGLAVTGARKNEAAELEWRDLDFHAGAIVLRGDPETATKNWKVHRAPMIPAARALFERMRAERTDEPLTAKVFRVREAQSAIDGACKRIGIPRFTHHDLRHLFAAVCIESGVDAQTVARFLNQKSGTALVERIYARPRDEHVFAQARKVLKFNEAVETKFLPSFRERPDKCRVKLYDQRTDNFSEVRYDFFCGASKVASQSFLIKDLPEFRTLLASLNIPELIRSSPRSLQIKSRQPEVKASIKAAFLRSFSTVEAKIAAIRRKRKQANGHLDP